MSAIYELCPESKGTSHVGRRKFSYFYCDNTAVDLDPLPASHAHLAMVVPALFK
jgi:hypothetical protein